MDDRSRLKDSRVDGAQADVIAERRIAETRFHDILTVVERIVIIIKIHINKNSYHMPLFLQLTLRRRSGATAH